MARTVLVENLRRLSLRILQSHQAIVGGERFADRLVVAVDEGPDALAARIAELEAAHADAPPAFLLRLSQRLTGIEVTWARSLTGWKPRSRSGGPTSSASRPASTSSRPPTRYP